jgi:glycosyltransferase involved in cell wall biosynthesis
MPVANLVGSLSKVRSSKLKLAWGVRASDMDLTCYDWFSRLTYNLERRFSRLPRLIIANSTAGRRYAVSRGFPDNDHFIVIPNGIEVERFHPDASRRDAMRMEWDVLPGETLVGIVARLDPMKDYPNFLKAAAKVSQAEPRVRFVSVGDGPESFAALLREHARSLGLGKKIIWAGTRSDVPAVYNALDLLVSSSAFGEGFSNVLGEAMACGVSCVATDVGDAREILGDSGTVVPPTDPDALAAGILALLDRVRLERASLADSARRRITENFSADVMVRRTEAALVSMP